MNDSKVSGTLGVNALERILAVTRQLAVPFELTALLAEVIDAGRDILGADRGTVFLYDEKTDELLSTVATGYGSIRLAADRGIAGECARTRHIINVPDCYADPRFNPETDRKTGYHTRCLLSLPLIGHDGSLVGVLQLLNKHDGIFNEQDERIAATLAAQCAVALQRVRMTQELVVKERLDRELAVARQIQMAVLPKEMPTLAGYEIAGLSRPAEETGGDTFDLIALDEHRLVLLLCDAMGHGIGPALSVTQVRSMLRIALRLGADVDTALANINDQLVADLRGQRFVATFLGLLDARSHEVRYHAAGQGPLLHFHAANGECEWHGPTTMPLGLMGHLPKMDSESLKLAPGDILGLITDGVFECENASLELFGEMGVSHVVRKHHGEPMSRLIEVLLHAVQEFTGSEPQADDITLLMIRRQRD